MCASTSTSTPSSPLSATDRVSPRPNVTTHTPRRAARGVAPRPGTGCRAHRCALGPSRSRGCAHTRPPVGAVALTLARVTGLHRLTEGERPAGLDLADHQVVTVDGNDVDLAVLAPPVALDHLHPAVEQVAHGEVLAGPAQRALARGRDAGPLGDRGSSRPGADGVAAPGGGLGQMIVMPPANPGPRLRHEAGPGPVDERPVKHLPVDDGARKSHVPAASGHPAHRRRPPTRGGGSGSGARQRR